MIVPRRLIIAFAKKKAGRRLLDGAWRKQTRANESGRDDGWIENPRPRGTENPRPRGAEGPRGPRTQATILTANTSIIAPDPFDRSSPPPHPPVYTVSCTPPSLCPSVALCLSHPVSSATFCRPLSPSAPLSSSHPPCSK